MEKHETNIAIVILNWNGKHFLEKFLPTLIENTDKVAEIWIVDNNSTDNSLEYLSKDFKSIKTIKLDKNYGFAGGYNRGLSQIDSKYYLLLNSDIEVPKNWLQPLYELIENNPDIGICGPKLLNYEKKTHLEYAGAAGGYLDRYGYPFCKGRIFDTCEQDNLQYDEISDCFWISGAALMIRSEIFKKAGGFDDDFFAHQEEIDLCWRVQNLGYRIVCQPKSYIYHVGGGTLPKSNPFKTYLNFRNNLYLIQKNMPKYNRQRVLISRFFLDYVAAFRMIIQGNFKECFAVFKAYLHFAFNCRKMSKKRKLLKPKSPKYLTGFYSKSIVFDYYLKNKNKFSDLNE